MKRTLACRNDCPVSRWIQRRRAPATTRTVLSGAAHSLWLWQLGDYGCAEDWEAGMRRGQRSPRLISSKARWELRTGRIGSPSSGEAHLRFPFLPSTVMAVYHTSLFQRSASPRYRRSSRRFANLLMALAPELSHLFSRKNVPKT